LGDVVEEADGDLMGDGVNIASRLEGICEPFGVCLSEDAWRQVRDRAEENFVDLGEHPLKNIARPVRLYAWKSGAAALAVTAASEKSGPPRLSIVVLPFKNLSSDPAQDYFADGVPENLTTDLSRIRNSFVIGRNTAFTFKDKPVDAKQVAKELGVRYVLKVRFSAIKTVCASTPNTLMAKPARISGPTDFQENVADLFKLQDDVMARLANALSYELVRAEAEAATRVRSHLGMRIRKCFSSLAINSENISQRYSHY
jgi:TolB-like protein